MICSVSGYRAQGTGRRAQGAGRGAWSMGHGAWGMGHDSILEVGTRHVVSLPPKYIK
jgi:hypothetical protein